MTSSSLKPTTFLLVAECLNQLHHHMPPKLDVDEFVTNAMDN
jgi:hypothetical protein